MFNNQEKSLPKILVTGASGFVGHYFLDRIKDHFLIFALERRIPQNSPLRDHPNIIWISADIGDMGAVQKAKELMLKYGVRTLFFTLPGITILIMMKIRSTSEQI